MDEGTATMLPSLKLLLQKLPTRLLVMQCRWEGGKGVVCVCGGVRFVDEILFLHFTHQVFGGAGFNQEYPVEKLMRDAKIFQVGEHIFCP